MLLATRMFVEGSISDELLQNITAKLIKHSEKEESIRKGLFDFILIMWQRKAACLRKETLDFLEHSEAFHLYLRQFKCSLWMILIDLMVRSRKGECHQTMLEVIGHRVKRDEFYVNYR